MKKNILICIISVLIFASCTRDFSKLEYKGDPFVNMPEGKGKLFEGSSTDSRSINIKVNRVSVDNSTPLTVNFTSTAKYVTGPTVGADASNTYTLLGEGGNANSLVIPAGKTSATIKLTTQGNGVLDGYKEVTVTLSGTGDGAFKIGYPGPSGAKKSTVITILDDEDLSFNIIKFLGVYSCSQTAVPANLVFDTEFVEGSLPNTLICKKFKLTLAPTVFNPPLAATEEVQEEQVIFVLNPNNGVITINQQEYSTTVVTNGKIVVAGSGTYDNATGNMRISYNIRLKNSSGAFFNLVDPYTAEYTVK